MTRELLKQALSAMHGPIYGAPVFGEPVRDAISAIQTFLAQPPPTPSAWLANYTDRYGSDRQYVSTDKALADENDSHGSASPLYTNPVCTEDTVRLILDAMDNIELRKPLAREIRRILGVQKS